MEKNVLSSYYNTLDASITPAHGSMEDEDLTPFILMDLPKHIDRKVWDSQFCVLRGHSSKFLNNDKFISL